MADASQRRPLAPVSFPCSSAAGAQFSPSSAAAAREVVVCYSAGRRRSPIDRAPNKPSQIGPMIIPNVDAAGFWGTLDPRTALC